MVGAFAVVLDSEGLDLIAAEGVCCLSQGNTLTGAGSQILICPTGQE